ncbi:ATP-binding protein [Geomobilimonas luticola]|uniref:ATP-binding protein n=1 Tax=Geomobilimonas luticola TaxID=1114878 RepID=A0ABS5SFR6_9BACT|nr:ATP-binding protein [Geomobilimonas luticola]MBT0654202.1 ATP-binding protein [Geomobilimonas luticola]
MKRYLSDTIHSDLGKKMVLLTGPRQVGKTTLAKELMAGYQRPQYLNWDVVDDRRVLIAQTWSPRPDLLVFDEIHKMSDWKLFLKGVFDGRTPGQAILVTGSARMETFRQSGESLAGRYFQARLHPFSVREWVEMTDARPGDALDRLIERGGLPEPFLADEALQAERWRQQYFTDLVREDVLEFSRIQEIRVMRLLVELLRGRVGSPLSVASLARDLQIAPNTVARYLEILEALYVIFLVRPYHRNVARAILKEPKVYFFDTGYVLGDAGIKWENACAAMLLKHIQFEQDVLGKSSTLHYLRTKDGAEVDFVLCENSSPSHLIECKHADNSPTPALIRFAGLFPEAQTLLLVRELRQEEYRRPVSIVKGAEWLAELAA